MKSAHFSPDSSSIIAPIRGMVLVVLFMASHAFLHAQEYTFLREYAGITGFVAEDSFFNKYSIDNGVLYKYSPDGQVLHYSNRQYGPVTYVDVNDPLNILVFFRNFGVVVFLDNKLAEKKIITPADLDLEEMPSKVCKSKRQGFWAYFPDRYIIKRYNMRAVAEVSSEDTSVSPGILSPVETMQERNERLFIWADGVWVFDIHGNFLFFLQHIQTPHFQVIQDKIFYLDEGYLVAYDYLLKKKEVFLLPQTDVNNFFVKDNSTLYLQSDVSLKEYKFGKKLF